MNHFWAQEGTVGWRGVSYASITIDLERVEPIAGVALHTAVGKRGVRWPQAVLVLTSDDGQTYRLVGDLVALDRRLGRPWPRDFTPHRLATDQLRTRGRFLRCLIVPGPGVPGAFVDEVEVVRGPTKLLQGAPLGETVGTMDALFARWSVAHAVRRRFDLDLAGVEQAIRSAGGFEQRTRVELLGRLSEVAKTLRSDHVTPEPSSAVLPLGEDHARLFGLQAALWRAVRRPNLVYWVRPTWDPLDLYALPPASSAGRIDMHLMRGEHRAAAFCLANSSDRPIAVSMRLEGMCDSAARCISLAGVRWTDTSFGRAVATAIEAGERADDEVVATIYPGLVRQVWLDGCVPRVSGDEDTDGLNGEQAGTLVVAAEGVEELRIPVALHVYPLGFPRQTTLMLGGWSYTNGNGHLGITETNRQALVEHLQNRLVNAPWATSSVMTQYKFTEGGVLELDTREFDRWIAEWPAAKRFHVSFSASNRFAGAEMGTVEFEQRVGQWISAWVGHLRGKGIGADRLALLLQDEPYEGIDVRPLLAWARAIERAEPEVLIWEDPTYTDPALAPQEVFEVSDVLCPNRPMWLAAGAEFAQFYLQQRRDGRELQFYSCSGPAHLLDPYSYYRLQAWHCWQAGATGCFFWSFSDNSGVSSWFPYLAKAGPYTPLFIDEMTVARGKQMEAIREGMQDYEYLAMLRAAVKKAKAAGQSDTLTAEAEALLAGAADEVLGAQDASRLPWSDPKDRTIADSVRLRILRALLELQTVK